MHVFRFVACILFIAELIIFFKQCDATRLEASSRNVSVYGKIDKDISDWTNINEEVDVVTPMVVAHLHKLGIEHLQLPDLNETLTTPLFVTYEVGLYLTNGIVFNVSGVTRYYDAFMTYQGKSFISQFRLKINKLQFEYNFLLKFMGVEGLGKILGSLDQTIVYAELSINVVNLKLDLKDFRIMEFRNIHVEVDQARLISQLTGIILSPITNLFKNRITTSIADSLKTQMQFLMDDFNNEDPLQLRDFTKKLLSGLTFNGTQT
ncbi:uncharacterized protein [Drosophila bipectinata]|uniref:uncharacterized protein isoform X2 n=1 Tax=Drosophila bipectinata TaxID=42026 RepID=UPI0038B306CA